MHNGVLTRPAPRAGAARTAIGRGTTNGDRSPSYTPEFPSMLSPSMPSWTGLRRSRRVAGLLSLLAPCSGHFYAGRPRRGLVLLAWLVCMQLIVVAAAFFLPPSFSVIVTFAATALVIWAGYCVFVLVDAVRLARRRDGARAASRWYECGAVMVVVWSSLFAMGALWAAAKPHLPWRMFDVTSSSMEPTLREKEWLLADTGYFRRNAPSRGDLVIYRLPKDPNTTFIKRVVAVAGDRVSFRNGQMLLNGAAVAEPYAKVGDPNAFINTTAEFVVRAEHVFVAGDNRANSLDSRAWEQHGPVPLENLVGRGTEIFLTDAPDRMGLWVGSPKQ
jgi:signal peptidase I